MTSGPLSWKQSRRSWPYCGGTPPLAPPNCARTATVPADAIACRVVDTNRVWCGPLLIVESVAGQAPGRLACNDVCCRAEYGFTEGEAECWYELTT